MTFIYKPPANSGLKILYQDTDFLVISKPENLLSVPGKSPDHADCLESRVQDKIPQARIVHRLDMATSGLMVMAMHADSHRNLGLQFERRKVKKTYIAHLWGHLKDKQGNVDLPLRCDWPNRPKQIVDHTLGKPAQTGWEVLDYKSIKSKDGESDLPITHIALHPVTGRSHQLRVHMQSLGHPILGDVFYAHEEALHASDRLCLHAQNLTFHHPEDGRIMSFEASCPF